MANTGYDWGSWAAMQISASDWTADAVADTATDTGDATSLDKKTGCEVGITLVEDNTGAIDGDVTVHVLGSVDGTNYENITTSGAWAFNITPVQNATVYKRFSIDPSMYGDFKLALENQSGQELAATVKYRTADFPAAS